MNALAKPINLLLAAVTCLALGVAWLRAQDAPAANDASSDKWTQIQDANKDMLKSMDTIDSNLNFVRIRAMQGGRSS